MSFEEMQTKLQDIVNNMYRISTTEEQTLKDLEQIYEQAKGNTEIGSEVKAAMEKLKEYDEGAKSRGFKGTLSDDQLSALEEKYNRISKALNEAKELKDNSTKDKIDDYVKDKIKNNKREKKIYEKENDCLKDKKRSLEGLYQTYTTNKKSEEVAEKIETMLDDISSELVTINDPATSGRDKENAKKKAEQLGNSVKTLLRNNAVKDKLGKYSGIFDTDIAAWNATSITAIKNGVTSEKGTYETARQNAERDFKTRLTTVPDMYRGTSAETFLQDIDKKYSKIEDKWKALGGRIKENDKKVQALKGENKAYKEYAEQVKEQARLEEIGAYSDEELDNHMRTEMDVDAIINTDAEVAALNTKLNHATNQLATLSSRKPKDMNMEDVLNYKRMKYLRQDPTKARKTLQEINEQIEDYNEWATRNGRPTKDLATMEELLNNDPKVQEVDYKGKNRFAWRAKFRKRAYCKEYYNDMVKKYTTQQTTAQADLITKRSEVGDAFREQYRVCTQADKDNISYEQSKFMSERYKRTIEGREPGDD